MTEQLRALQPATQLKRGGESAATVAAAVVPQCDCGSAAASSAESAKAKAAAAAVDGERRWRGQRGAFGARPAASSRASRYGSASAAAWPCGRSPTTTGCRS